MTGTASVKPPPAYSADDEPFLRWTIFETLVGLLFSSGTLGCFYLAITGASPNARLWVFWLTIFLAIALLCVFDVRRRVLDARRGRKDVPSVGKIVSGFWRVLGDSGGANAGTGFGLIVGGLILLLLPLWLLASLIAYVAAGRNYNPLPPLDRRGYAR
jgi:hypothetical protein